MPGTPPQPGFWICGHCRTPNPVASYITRCVGCGAARAPGAAPPPASPGSATSSRPTITGRPPAWLSQPGARFKASIAWLELHARLMGAALLKPWLGWLSLAAAGLLLLLLLFVRLLGETLFPATLLLYSPRILFLFPLALLALIAAVRRNRSVLAFLVAAGVLLGLPWLSFNVPIGRLMSLNGSGLRRVNILSFNAHHGENLKIAEFLDLIDRHQVQVVCFQE